MPDTYKPLIDRDTLRREFTYEYEDFQESQAEQELLERLRNWPARTITAEAQIEAAFIARFFEETWGYRPDGHGATGFSLQQQFTIQGAGAGGNQGSADLALGNFGSDGSGVAQVLCEFKGIGADLDRPQARKGNTRSPARQALDYLSYARRGIYDSAPVLPRFAIATDMNQFRLYWYDLAPESYLAFRIDGATLFERTNLLSQTEEGRFDRFLFWRLFRPDMLLSEYGRTALERLIARQGETQKRLEREFYEEYRQYRNAIFNQIKLNPLPGVSEREKLRLAQKLLDRLVFIMFAEDMGQRIAFPPRLLSEELSRASLDPFYEPEGDDFWRRLVRIFRTMDAGGTIGPNEIHRFNGGLFAHDPLLDQLSLPNHLFCKHGQGRNAATIRSEKQTLLYLAATYNFAADADTTNSIGLYTLGHIFEQSLVELEVLEAQAEDRLSLSVITKRKRDGVYYTPEPIVRRIIDETLGPLLARWREEAGWLEGTEPRREALETYWDRLRDIRCVDPACGSGAFLIALFRALLSEFKATLDARYDARLERTRVEDADIAAMILANNIYGVDINPLSVEIAQLSLWLHSARPRQPLSTFSHTVRCGNSLVSPTDYNRLVSDDGSNAARARVAPFDWDQAFPEIAGRGGFDVVVGNPPYVKLQHFRRVYEETANFLRNGLTADGEPLYRSTQTGNYDLYLPFIEKGLTLLREGGRMGYIAPNLWPTLQYGEALRAMVVKGRNLERWIDFRAHQVFEEATIYTAIQVFTREPAEHVAVSWARDGDLGKVDMTQPEARIPFSELDPNGGEWLFAPDGVRRLIGRLGASCRRLDDPEVTSGIIVGIQTSADHIYHLERVGDGRYRHHPPPVNGRRPPAFMVDVED